MGTEALESLRSVLRRLVFDGGHQEISVLMVFCLFSTSEEGVLLFFWGLCFYPETCRGAGSSWTLLASCKSD